ncbi:MAG: hypothetical protein SOT46_07430 [Treponema sp.]|nr:hypothetical protein [Treponema sp.]MDY5123143.1 hypothetical protein [Treponema sp.]
MELKKAAIYILTVLLLFICSTAVFAEELVIPVIKSPYKIDKAEWVNNGREFAITTNNETYVRDTLDLSLKDKYPQKNNTELIGNFPSPVIAYGKNKNGSLTAAACEDKNVYLYDSISGETKSIGTHNTKSTSIAFIKNNQILIADSENSAGIYSLTGEKLKTFAAAQKITSVETTSDGETVILGQDDGSMHFYSTDNSKEIGFVPALNSSGIKALSINNESTRMLATYNDGSVYYVLIGDALFSPSTVAPSIKNFPIVYNALTAEEDETAKVQEFAIKEIDETETIDTEFIASTRELKNNQKFEINEKKEKGESVIIKKNQQEKNFTYTQGTDSDITLQKKYPDLENNTYVQEFNQNLSEAGLNPITPQKDVEIFQDNKGKVTEFPPITEPNGNMYGNNSNTGSETGGQRGQSKENNPLSAGSGAVGQGGQSKGSGTSGQGGQSKENNPLSAGSGAVGQGGQSQGSGAGSGYAGGTGDSGSGTGNGEPELSPEELKAQAAAEKKAQKEAEKAEREAQEEARKAEEKERKTKDKKEKELKERKVPEEEDIKTLFKDGHGILANAGIHFMSDPNLLEISLPVGYRNYDLIRPFYFGGTVEPYFSIPDKEYPFNYTVGGEKMKSPSLVGTKIYVPAGFCIYPLRNSLEIYTEMGLGVSLNQLWNRKLGSKQIHTKVYPAFFGNLKVGAAWDFLNLSLCANYDAILGISFGAEIGAIVNIGGSRTIGSLKYK